MVAASAILTIIFNRRSIPRSSLASFRWPQGTRLHCGRPRHRAVGKWRKSRTAPTPAAALCAHSSSIRLAAKEHRSWRPLRMCTYIRVFTYLTQTATYRFYIRQRTRT
ncbi:unnamed protein product [Trichogramma brassicae]|uniref:Uncharacterized protein n=1 Tax=Trichogramma brassicae TaxID=86971 RepID=A0A6H5IBU7_9HYME|nr:unnamed protein product [Trichogramma brassicae]